MDDPLGLVFVGPVEPQLGAGSDDGLTTECVSAVLYDVDVTPRQVVRKNGFPGR